MSKIASATPVLNKEVVYEWLVTYEELKKVMLELDVEKVEDTCEYFFFQYGGKSSQMNYLLKAMTQEEYQQIMAYV